MMQNAASGVEDQKAQPFGPHRQIGFRERHAFERGDHIVREHCQSQPGGISSETGARQHAGGEFVFQHVMDGFNGPGLLAMPFQQTLGFRLPYVRDHREVLGFGPSANS
jgi:hypothetical protein